MAWRVQSAPVMAMTLSLISVFTSLGLLRKILVFHHLHLLSSGVPRSTSQNRCFGQEWSIHSHIPPGAAENLTTTPAPAGNAHSLKRTCRSSRWAAPSLPDAMASKLFPAKIPTAGPSSSRSRKRINLPSDRFPNRSLKPCEAAT